MGCVAERGIGAAGFVVKAAAHDVVVVMRHIRANV